MKVLEIVRYGSKIVKVRMLEVETPEAMLALIQEGSDFYHLPQVEYLGSLLSREIYSLEAAQSLKGQLNCFNLIE